MDTDQNTLRIYREEPMTPTKAESGISEPPFFTGIDDMEPNDDFGEPKKRGDIDHAAKEFKKYFDSEPWFVQLLKSPSATYLICVVDARYWPKGRVKYRPWMGYPLAVAPLQGLPAATEKKRILEQVEQEQPHLPEKLKVSAKKVQRAADAFHEKYKGEKWYIGVQWVANDTATHLVVNVDGRYWGGKTGNRFGAFPVVVVVVPGKIIEAEDGFLDAA